VSEIDNLNLNFKGEFAMVIGGAEKVKSEEF
jgi:hypothetical protein